jgi:N-acetylglucosaminyldiphosphoundecaprenol N-acetyl-beta-D-mannosaminyltransferase
MSVVAPTAQAVRPWPRRNILGCRVDCVSFAEATAVVADAVITRSRVRLVAVNVDQVMKCRRDPAFAAAIRDADLCFADGVPVVWAARLLGRPLAGRVSGTDLVWEIARVSATARVGVALVGGRPGVATRAALRMAERFPGARLHVIPTPTPLGEVESRELVDRIRSVQTSIVLVALGAPRQELWVQAHLAESGAAVGVGIGSAFDIISGDAARAPRWLRDHGFEWLHRLAQDPRRLGRRYVIEDSPFVGLVAVAALRRMLGVRS